MLPVIARIGYNVFWTLAAFFIAAVVRTVVVKFVPRSKAII